MHLICTVILVLSFDGCVSKDHQNVTNKTGKVSVPSQQLMQTQEPKSKVMVQQTKWLFVGDSLTAGFGLEAQSSYVSVLGSMIKTHKFVDSTTGLVPKLINAGVSGDTSTGALRRLSWLLADQPHRIFLCIGANDGLRGQPLELLKSNLSNLTKMIKSKGIDLMLMGMRIPPNYGIEYSKGFAKVYAQVAQEQNVPLYPFLLVNVAGHSHLNQTDGIHPNREGHQLIAQQLFNHLKVSAIIKKN